MAIVLVDRPDFRKRGNAPDTLHDRLEAGQPDYMTRLGGRVKPGHGE
ncbi:MAG: hypothetical protein ABIN69_01520 [Aestuariivirga sp.]